MLLLILCRLKPVGIDNQAMTEGIEAKRGEEG
jgi:hypothetical protein